MAIIVTVSSLKLNLNFLTDGLLHKQVLSSSGMLNTFKTHKWILADFVTSARMLYVFLLWYGQMVDDFTNFMPAF